MGVKYVFNPLSGELDAVLDLDSPLMFKGDINISADFPLLTDVKTGWFYTISTDVTDNDVSKTNTGTSFLAGDEIAWNGSDWTLLGNLGTFTEGSVSFGGTDRKLTEDNNNLFWDNTNKRLSIGTDSPTEKLEVTGNIRTTIDSQKYYAGTDKDLSITYDGVDGIIKSDEVTPSDLLLHCGLNKTLELQHAVTDDMQIDIGAVRLPPANAAIIVVNPADNIGLAIQFENGKNQSIHFNMQSPHARVDESNIELHMHVTPGASTNTGNVYMRLVYDWRNIDGTFGGTTTVFATFAMDGTPHKHQYEDIFNINGTGKSSISSIICCELTRMGTDVLDTFTGDIYAVGIDFHVLKNTLGSRQEIIK